MTRLALATALLFTAAQAWAADMTPAEAFEAGRAFGLSPHGAEAVMEAISGASADNVPHYDTANAHSVYYGGGVGDPLAPGNARVTECSTVVYEDAKQQVESDAINDVAKNRAMRPPLVIAPKDPLLVKGNTIKADPASVAGAFGGAYSACSTIDVVTPATYEEEICNEFKSLGEEVCHKTLTVTVTVDQSCTPGTWYLAGAGLFTLVEAYCEPDRTDGQLYLRFTPNGMHGICQYGYATVPKAPFTIVPGQDLPNMLLTTAINHWKGRCTVPIDIGYGVGPHGCSGGTCRYVFEYQDYRWGHHLVAATDPFTEPRRTVTESDAWVNACAQLEARAQ